MAPKKDLSHIMTKKQTSAYLVLAMLSILTLSCGQTGPLYLPGEQAPIHVEDDEVNED